MAKENISTGDLLSEWAAKYFPNITNPESKEYPALANYMAALTVNPSGISDEWLSRVLPDMAQKGQLLLDAGANLELLIATAEFALLLSAKEISMPRRIDIIEKLKSEFNR